MFYLIIISGCVRITQRWLEGGGHSGLSGQSRRSGRSEYSGHSGRSRHSGCSGCSGIVVYGAGDIVFGAKRSHSIHCSQHLLHSHWQYPHHHCIHCIDWFDLFVPKQCSHHHILLFNCVHCIHWFDHFTRKTLCSPPYTAIPLVWHCYTKDNDPTTIYHYSTASAVFTGWPFCTKDNVSTTIFHYFTVSTAYFFHRFDLFGPKKNVSTIIYHYSTGSFGLTFIHQRHCPNHHIPLFPYVQHIHWFNLFAPKTMSPPTYTTILLHSLHPLCGLTFLH